MQQLRRSIVVCRDADSLSQEAAEMFARWAREAVAATDRFSVALSGGSTPQRMYSLLASETHRSRVPWQKVQVLWGDERCVPPDHKDSNYRMAHEALLGQVPIPEENVHRIPAELEPAEAALRYEETLRRVFGLEPGQLPRIDLALMGMGEDGHTASLFPGTAALEERQRLVVSLFVEKLGVHRITMSVPVINEARRVLFLVAGREKATALREVLHGPQRPRELPAQLIRPEGRLIYLIDRAADAEGASQPED